MYVKAIRTQGFKSFADKIDLDLIKGINAIVGPNGSGKSNVVDAILWVLGEQSVKQLRGDSAMADVIFSGSKTRDALNKASVSILFDNSDHVLASEFNEVEVKRVIYKTGENEYYINGSRVRLKDVSDLLIDVTSKFNIITQGNINALVENKSSERRALFENAAGVLKYKKRKEEALKKLEGTKENLTRVELIIKELNTTLGPLEKEKKDAENYVKVKSELENVEIALMANDITYLNNKYEKLKNENAIKEKEKEEALPKDPSKIEKLKLDKITLDEDITKLNNKLNDITGELALLKSQKEINIERSKFSVDSKTIDANLLEINEKKLKCDKDISILENELESLKNELKSYTTSLNEKSDEEIKTKVNLSNLNAEISRINKDILELQNKINIEIANIENGAFLPRSVSSIVNNPHLEGIHNTIGNLIEVNEAHITAINTALGAASNYIIVDSMNYAKKAISYLKENKLGRATFFPIDVIEARRIPEDIEKTVSNKRGFIGIASDLVETKEKYQNIISNQLGNVIVVDTIDDLDEIAKLTNYKYKMVSLEGDIIFPGGSISGGNIRNESHDKSLLNKLKNDLEKKKNLLVSLNSSLQKDETKYNILEEDYASLSKKITESRLVISTKENLLKELQEESKKLEKDVTSIKAMDSGNLDEEINKILKEIIEKEKEKELNELNLRDLNSKKFDLSNEIETLEKAFQEENAKYHHLENEINNNEIEIGKLEVRIDTILENLSNDYNLTYEYALNNYSLDMDIEVARSTVSRLRSDLKRLNNVNVGAIEEYDRLKRRFDFLSKQKEDLEVSSNELLNIISEMDEIMKTRFKETFNKIAYEFSKVFRQMFKGGNGLLKLTDETDLLNTGINILAVPPGKKLNSTASLSGGEKALTAICLIFAILKVKPAPFIVLDEPEAPLDEANVDMFGEYLNSMKDQSQFILITHKKRMMEYADSLIGITMEESGVSKLVSVKLEEK